MLTPDFNNLILVSDSSILDMVLFHEELRDIEASVEGMLYPVIHTYKELPLGGGAIFPALEFINSWTLEFQTGNFLIKGGNLKVNINPVNNCYVNQTQSLAYAVTAVGGSVEIVTAQDLWEYADRTLSTDVTISSTQMAKIDELLDIEKGDWRIDGNQMIFKTIAGAELMRFNLFNASNIPSSTNVTKRERV